MKKRMFLIASPPASGKTYVSKMLAQHLDNPVYLDKDTIIPLSKQVFKAKNEPYNRDSLFFKEYVRDAEYIAIMDVAFEALDFNDNVIINAPFGKELRSAEYIKGLKNKLQGYDAELIAIWVYCSLEVIHERMVNRNSERDKWKLEHWDEYIKSQNFSTPQIEGLTLVENTNEASAIRDLKHLFAKNG